MPEDVCAAFSAKAPGPFPWRARYARPERLQPIQDEVGRSGSGAARHAFYGWCGGLALRGPVALRLVRFRGLLSSQRRGVSWRSALASLGVARAVASRGGGDPFIRAATAIPFPPNPSPIEGLPVNATRGHGKDLRVHLFSCASDIRAQASIRADRRAVPS